MDNAQRKINGHSAACIADLRGFASPACLHLISLGYSHDNIAEGCGVSRQAVTQWVSQHTYPEPRHLDRLLMMACANGFVLPGHPAELQPLTNGDGCPTDEAIAAVRCTAEAEQAAKRGQKALALKLAHDGQRYLLGMMQEVAR